ncbi:Hypothetical predicted protein [Cloeon dipterum]|uniref:Uncharacterized protein n=1 Tax=Cloeon dipterum TaxID=197152 RepID=A0A8S1E1U4_9INSE|nr:Hypothetical predicted protein [Cloeon dipterum]
MYLGLPVCKCRGERRPCRRAGRSGRPHRLLAAAERGHEREKGAALPTRAGRGATKLCRALRKSRARLRRQQKEDEEAAVAGGGRVVEAAGKAAIP